MSNTATLYSGGVRVDITYSVPRSRGSYLKGYYRLKVSRPDGKSIPFVFDDEDSGAVSAGTRRKNMSPTSAEAFETVARLAVQDAGYQGLYVDPTYGEDGYISFTKKPLHNSPFSPEFMAVRAKHTATARPLTKPRKRKLAVKKSRKS